jgi:hypothetical protein
MYTVDTPSIVCDAEALSAIVLTEEANPVSSLTTKGCPSENNDASRRKLTGTAVMAKI